MVSENQIQFLLDTEEIRDLARRYAHCVWQRDGQAAGALFAEDGVMDPPKIQNIVHTSRIRGLQNSHS